MKREKIIRRISGLLLLPVVVLGCARTMPASREQVLENLDPMIKVEQRGQKLVSVMQQLPLYVEVDAENAKRLKEHYNVYYVHHNAATLLLAQGNVQAYKEHLKVASKELDSIEEELKSVVQKSTQIPARPN